MARNLPSSNDNDLLGGKSPTEKDMGFDLQKAQERVLALRREMEEAERRERELESLRQRRLEVTNGQRDLHEKLTRALTLLERAEHVARRDLEQIGAARDTFQEQLKQVESIDMESWGPNEIDPNLSKSQTLLDHAAAIFNQYRAKVEFLSERDTEGEPLLLDEDRENFSITGGGSFFELVKRGFALSLPLIIILTGILLALLFHIEPTR